ncbi:Nidogen-2 [Toxocara canis]|uniref:Nidogen-2 n=1 Tax=Toxocara canis TaxID=6265 RepID=A0A0B2VFD0_TOXCA|nr:Nidogen-2 [Toxocara canis]
MEPLDPGPCQYYQVKWFWDKADEECKEFHYGGCLGSRNRFDNKQQCMKQCIYKMHNPVAVPDLCLLDVDPGHCNDDRRGQWWYYFNPVTGECDKFFYYGCGGNDNRFYSLYQCRKVCGERLAPQIACERCDIRTSFCKSHSKYNYTCECRDGYAKNAHDECIDIDECRLHTAKCDRNAWCTNTIGSYNCECMAGYRGDGKRCTFVGIGRSSVDCADCSPHATCSNGVCMCKEGFIGDGFNCSDVNECLRAPYVCDKNAECRNTDGSFICECLPGFAGNGYTCTTSKNACLDSFDRGYQQQCGSENWREHYYLDHQTKRCSLFWYDGCPGTSRNIFSSLETCETMCEMTNVLARAEICWDKFDTNYRNQCLDGNWQQRFYFDHASMTCRLFWYDGCSSKSRNIFEDLLTCQWLCVEQPMYKSRSCLEPFDEHYRDECNGGRWRQQFFFDKQRKKCVGFWYDGCTGDSQNIFQDEMTCMQLCEQPTRKDPHMPWHHRDKHKMIEELDKIFLPNVTNICDIMNPCENNGTCHFDRNKNTHYCKCAPGYTNANCTEKIEFDPCSSNPCKNGATCSAKAGKSKTTFECFCAIGYGGEFCESKPCESNPCLNNGTCRTTRGFSTFFCDCPPKFGGKLCDIAVGETKPPTYGKNVQLLSSGKVEWIEQLKKIKAKEREMKLKGKTQQNDQPAKEASEQEKTRKKELRQSGKEEDIDEQKVDMKKAEAHNMPEHSTQPSTMDSASYHSCHIVNRLIPIILLFITFCGSDFL